MLRRFRSFARECSDLRRCFKATAADLDSLVFYSEGAVHSKFFEDIIEEILSRSDLKIYYATSDADDPCFMRRNERFQVFYVNSLVFLLIPFVKAKAITMTMPDLSQLHVMKSMRGAHHFYLPHGIGSVHMVLRKGALDHYDTIFCVGPHQVREIRKTEEIYELPAKQLIESGYPLIDRMYAHHRQAPEAEEAADGRRVSCLVAPSWSPQNIAESCLSEIVRPLAATGHQVIFRPHPEFVRLRYEQLERSMAELRKLENVAFEINPTSNRSLHAADILITDWSAIGMEYAFGTERPVLYIDTPPKTTNPEYERLEMEPLDIKLRTEIGRLLGMDELDRICEVVSDMVNHHARYREEILRCREAYISNFGSAATKIASHMIDYCS